MIRDALKLGTTLAFGIPWYQEIRELSREDWTTRIKEATDPQVLIPSWFDLPIHGILGGNDLTQAIEQAPAMAAMASQFGHEPGMRDVRLPHLEAFAPALPSGAAILDVGCGTGDSLRALEARYADAALTGIDLSPAMIAVGRLRNAHKPYDLFHRAGEETRFADQAFDMVHESAVAHEVPRFASIRRFAESFRILKPGGVFFFLDQDPESPVIQRQLRPDPLGHFIEPHIRSYSRMNTCEELQKIGFIEVERKKLAPDSTIVVIVAKKPGSARLSG
jgi:SAM-dependent methyltransferase